MNIQHDSGFTLVEIIMVVVIIGIVATFTLVYMISGVSGFVFSKQNFHLSQKAGLTLARINKEFNDEIKEIELISATSIKYVYQYNPRNHRYLALVGSGARKEIKLVVGGAVAPGVSDPEVLIDQVSDFNLAFKKCDNSPWTLTDGKETLCTIVVTMTLFLGPNTDRTFTFTTTMHPPQHYDTLG